MTVAKPPTSIELIALDWVYGRPRRSPLGSVENRWVLAIIGLHLALTSFLAATLNLWIDEAYSLATTDNNLPTTLQWAVGFEEQAPFYFVLLWLVRHLQDSIFMARLPSILAVAFTLWLASCISKQLFPLLHRSWVVLALAFNPFLIAIALEARVYAWALMLSTLLLWLFLKGYAAPLLDPDPGSLVIRPLVPAPNAPWTRWAYGLAAVLAIYSHYFLAFQLVAQGLLLFLVALLIPDRRRKALHSFGAYCLDSTIIALITLPLVFVIQQQLTALLDNGSNLEAATPLAVVKTAIGKTLFRNLVYLLPSDPAGTPGLGWKLLRLFAGFWLLGLAWGRRRCLRFNVGLAWVIHGLVMLQLFGAFALVPSVEYRHGILMLGLAYFSALGLMSLLPRSRRRLLLSLSLILLLCLNARCLWQVYSPLAKPGDYARVGQYLQEVVGPQEPVVVFNSEVALALGHYYPSHESQPASNQTTNWATKLAAELRTPIEVSSPQPLSNATLALRGLTAPLGKGQRWEAIASPHSPLIALPRPILNADQTIPRYHKSNRLLTSTAQIEQALAQTGPFAAPLTSQPMNPPRPQASTAVDLEAIHSEALKPEAQNQDGLNQELQDSAPQDNSGANPQANPQAQAIAELEAKVRRANLDPEAEAQVRAALDLPPLAALEPDRPAQPQISDRSSLQAAPTAATAATSQTAIASQASAAIAPAAIPPTLPDRFWLVSDSHILTAMPVFEDSYRYLNDFMAQHYRLVRMRQFYGTRVQQWERLPSSRNALKKPVPRFPLGSQQPP